MNLALTITFRILYLQLVKGRKIVKKLQLIRNTLIIIRRLSRVLTSPLFVSKWGFVFHTINKHEKRFLIGVSEMYKVFMNVLWDEKQDSSSHSSQLSATPFHVMPSFVLSITAWKCFYLRKQTTTWLFRRPKVRASRRLIWREPIRAQYRDRYVPFAPIDNRVVGLLCY